MRPAPVGGEESSTGEQMWGCASWSTAQHTAASRNGWNWLGQEDGKDKEAGLKAGLLALSDLLLKPNG